MHFARSMAARTRFAHLLCVSTPVVCASCAAPLLADDAPLPDRLSELPFESARRTVPYAPTWPLWSNGLEKRRWLYTPGRDPIDTEDRVWDWPVGSLLFKEFAWDGGLVETRVMRREADDWDYATYVWDGDDAWRLPAAERVELDAPAHTIPSRYECRLCHEPAGGPIGLRPRQLSQADLDVFGDRFSPAVEPVPITGHDATTTDVLGYFIGNCVHCHDGRRSKQTAFDLRPDAALDNLIGVETRSPLLPGGVRVQPGSAEESQLFLALLQSESGDVSAMPPAGVDRVDEAAVDLFREWIDGLDPLEPEGTP